jgi:PKD repeat protein
VAVFTLTIADADVPRVIAALCDNFGYAEVTAGNAMAGVMVFITQVVANVEAAAARQAALATLPPIAPIAVASSPPVAALTAAPATGAAPLLVTADASGSSDPQGLALSYSFDFGDGFVLANQTVATASHTYSTAGTYTLTLTATNTAGLSSTGSATITVTA